MILPERYKDIDHPIILENIKDIDCIRNIFVKHFKKDIENTKGDPLKYLYKIVCIACNSENLEELKVVYEPIVFMTKPLIFIQDFDKFFSLVDKKKYPDAKQKFKFESISSIEFYKYIGEYNMIAEFNKDYMYMRDIKNNWLKDDDVK